MAYGGMTAQDVFEEARVALGNPSTNTYTTTIGLRILNRIIANDIAASYDIPTQHEIFNATIDSGATTFAVQPSDTTLSIQRIKNVICVADKTIATFASYDDMDRKWGTLPSTEMDSGTPIEYWLRWSNGTEDGSVICRIQPKLSTSTTVAVSLFIRPQYTAYTGTNPLPNEFDEAIVYFMTAKLASLLRLHDDAVTYSTLAFGAMQKAAVNINAASAVFHTMPGFGKLDR